jgi:hypothetical protein
MTPQEKAHHSEALKTNPVFKLVMSDIREALVGKLEASAIGDVDTHHEVALSLQLLKQIGAQLQRYIDDQTLIEHKSHQDTFLRKMRKSITP